MTSTVLGVQHYSLTGRGQALGVVVRDRFAFVEDAQVVMRVGGQPDHVGHRQQGSPAGDSPTGLGLQFAQGGGDDDGGRQPVVLTYATAGQQGTPGGVECIVGAYEFRGFEVFGVRCLRNASRTTEQGV